MKEHFSPIALARLCGWFGLTRQAWYQAQSKTAELSVEVEVVLKEVEKIRQDHKRMGTRKLHEKLQSKMKEHGIKIGRDRLFDLLSANQMLVRRRRRNIRTTNSNHWLRKYPNLTKDLIPTAPNQLWVSDITYWKINRKPVYLSFITDAYSHKIVGYNLSETLEAAGSLNALNKALLTLKTTEHQLIHHSDRGLQYCSHAYIKTLKDRGIEISMTESGDPLENPVAERVNGIIKEEYLEQQSIMSVKEGINYLHKAIELYNLHRPHLSINKYTPEHIHSLQKTDKPIKRAWKNYYPKKRAPVNQ